MSLDVEPPRLRCYGGNTAPAEARRIWAVQTAWPDAAIQQLWFVLRPLVENPRGKQPAEALRRFCQTHGLARTEVGQVGALLHNLLLRAAAIDLPKPDFAADLDLLGGGAAARAVLTGYEPAKRTLRARLLHASLAAHGKLMTGVSWRMDHVGDTDAAHALAAPVLLLTLDWQEGDVNGRTTLQLTPSLIQILKSVLERF